MELLKFVVSSFLLCTMSLSSLGAALSSSESSRLRSSVQKKRFKAVGHQLKDAINSSRMTLSEVEQFARSVRSVKLLKAVNAARLYQRQDNDIGLSVGSFFEAAFFIETDFKKFAARRSTRLLPKKTGIERVIEYDRRNRKVFIVLDGSKSAFLGKGHQKVAYKAVQYNKGRPEVVARAEVSGEMNHELMIAEKVQGRSSVFDLKGFVRHKKGGKNYTASYSKLYNAKDLKMAYESGITFSAWEKMKIAADMLQGLESLHSKKIVHRDMSWKNFFLSIPEGEPKGRRNVEAVIADFGLSKFVKELKGKKPQINSWHTAPEGFYLERLKGDDYFKIELFGAGLVLYRLFYEREPEWIGFGAPTPNRQIAKNQAARINSFTEARRSELKALKEAGKSTAVEDFEYIVLRMVDIDASNRGSARSLRHEVLEIMSRTK